MATRHLTLRLSDDTLVRLEAQSRLTGQNRSELARTLLEEGLRMEAHPGIIFRSGPAGRRAGLSGGPDIWEIARVFRGVSEQMGDAVRQAAELTELSPEQIRAALGYYADYRDEIDDWIRRVDDGAMSAEATWRRRQHPPNP